MASVQSQHPDTLKAHRHVAAESLIAITGPERGGPRTPIARSQGRLPWCHRQPYWGQKSEIGAWPALAASHRPSGMVLPASALGAAGNSQSLALLVHCPDVWPCLPMALAPLCMSVSL